MQQSTEPYGLSRTSVQQIQQLFSRFSQIDTVILYGSRAKGNYRPGSDIDLTLKTQKQEDLHLLTDVMNALDDLNLPYGFDISLFQHIKNDSLIEHINRVGVEFYNTKTYKAQQQSQKQRQDYKQQTTQSEAQLETELVSRLKRLGYELVSIRNAEELKANLKKQLEIHNDLSLSDLEFAKVLNYLDT